MNSNKCVGILLGLIFILFLIGANGSDLGLPSFITTNRIAIVLLILLNVAILYKNDMKIKFNKAVLFIFLSCIFTAFWGLISILISPYYVQTSVAPIITWLLIGLTIVLMSNVFLSSNKIMCVYFLNSIIIAGAIMVVVYFLWGYLNVGNLTNQYMWTKTLNQTSNGQSRIMNGLLLINIINLTVVFGSIRKGRLYFIISLITLSIFFIFTFITGSRQTLLALFASGIFILIVNLLSNKKNSKKRLLTISLSITFLISTISFLVKFYNISELIKARFVERTIDFTSSDQSRLNIVKEAFSFLESNPFFGVGPGAFTSISSVGIYTHNGYANMFVNFGIIPTTLLIVIVLITLFIGFKKIVKFEGGSIYNIKYIALISVFIYSMISFMFNDLMDEYFFWIMVALLVSMPNYTNHIKLGSDSN